MSAPANLTCVRCGDPVAIANDCVRVYEQPDGSLRVAHGTCRMDRPSMSASASNLTPMPGSYR